MKKITFICCLLMFWGWFAHAQEQQGKVSEVVIKGLQNVKERTVRQEIKTRSGRPYAEETVRSDVQSILGLNHFENVEVSVDTATYRVTFELDEKPYIKEITFKGNKKISTGKLKETIPLKEKEFYDLTNLDESKSKIEELYSEKGYADRRVEAIPTIDESTNRMTVTYLITEGNRILTGDVTIRGTSAYKPRKIRKLMKTRPKKVFKQEVLREDIDKILEFYKNNGYMQAEIEQPQISYNENRDLVNVALTIHEGPKFKIGEVSFAGNSVYGEDELRKALTLKSGKVYREEEFQENRFALLELYSNKGYLHSQVEPKFTPDPEKGVMDIEFEIFEGDIVNVGNIYVDGLKSTKEYVIRREIMLKEGDVLAAGKVRRSIEKIYNLGFIDGVEPQLQPVMNDPGVMDLVFDVTEGKPGILSAGAGYSSVDKLVGTLQVQHINLLGRGQRLNLLWEFGARKQNYEIDWTEPWFLAKPMSLGFGIFNTERERDYSDIVNAYTEGRRGGSVRVGPRLDDRLSLLFSYTYEEVSVSRIAEAIRISASSDVIKETHDVTSSVSSQIVFDTRDNIFDANRGSRNSLALQLAGANGLLGGNVNYIKTTARSSWFFPSFWKFVFSVNGTFGVVDNIWAPNDPNQDVPIYERFYVGGAETVRGYQYRSEIGPPEGGKVMSVLNMEYKFPIVQEKKRTVLQGAFFFDVGGAWRSMNDFNLEFGEDENRIKAGVGFGLRFTTPVFPLRLDWGYGLHHRPGEAPSQFYFTIGNVF